MSEINKDVLKYRTLGLMLHTFFLGGALACLVLGYHGELSGFFWGGAWTSVVMGVAGSFWLPTLAATKGQGERA